MRALRVIPLPTVDEVLRELPRLLLKSGELAPRRLHGPEGRLSGPEYTFAVSASLSPAWSNIDFEPELGRLDELERHFFERQIERTHRDLQLERTGRSPWVLKRLEGATLADASIRDGEEPWGALALEVPCLSTDCRRAVLRGQRCETYCAEDFEHWLKKVNGRWTLA